MMMIKDSLLYFIKGYLTWLSTASRNCLKPLFTSSALTAAIVIIFRPRRRLSCKPEGSFFLHKWLVITKTDLVRCVAYRFMSTVSAISSDAARVRVGFFMWVNCISCISTEYCHVVFVWFLRNPALRAGLKGAWSCCKCILYTPYPIESHFNFRQHLACLYNFCRQSAGHHARHSAVNDLIKRALASADVPARLEPSSLSRDDGKRPDGLSTAPWKEGRCL